MEVVSGAIGTCGESPPPPQPESASAAAARRGRAHARTPGKRLRTPRGRGLAPPGGAPPRARTPHAPPRAPRPRRRGPPTAAPGRSAARSAPRRGAGRAPSIARAPRAGARARPRPRRSRRRPPEPRRARSGSAVARPASTASSAASRACVILAGQGQRDRPRRRGLDRLGDQPGALAHVERLAQRGCRARHVAAVAQRDGEAEQRRERHLGPADLLGQLVGAAEQALGRLPVAVAPAAACPRRA